MIDEKDFPVGSEPNPSAPSEQTPQEPNRELGQTPAEEKTPASPSPSGEPTPASPTETEENPYQNGNPYYGAPTPPQPPRQSPYRPEGGQKPKRPKKPKKALLVAALVSLYAILVVALIAALSGELPSAQPAGGEGETQETETGRETGRENLPPIQTNPSNDLPIVGEGYTGNTLSAADLYEKNVNSVVFVQANYSSGMATGSGFVIDSTNGYILTNYHVIEDSKDVAVTFYNGDSYEAKVVGGDEINDVAVLKIQAQGLSHVTVGNSDQIRIGDDVLVIGNPLGDLTFTLTKGIVSGVERAINTGEYTIDTFQTDAAINSGNSGGPAFDATGAVIGIASAKYSATGVEGIGFCIPINDAMEIAKDLVEHGYVTGRPNFGISVSTSPGYRYEIDSYGRRVRVETTFGATIEEIGKDSCAAKAGLQIGDIVTKLNDTKITTASDLINAKNRYKAGDTVVLTVYRDKGTIVEISVTLDEYIP